MDSPDGSRDRSADSSGAKKEEHFWDRDYKAQRYVNPDGTTVPLYDQIMIESSKFNSGIDGAKLKKIIPAY